MLAEVAVATSAMIGVYSLSAVRSLKPPATRTPTPVLTSLVSCLALIDVLRIILPSSASWVASKPAVMRMSRS
ncbi:hypothetical protein D3C71_2072570 [compost metagenome]